MGVCNAIARNGLKRRKNLKYFLSIDRKNLFKLVFTKICYECDTGVEVQPTALASLILSECFFLT